jgi:predicted alpha/beta-fold hydrolase
MIFMAFNIYWELRDFWQFRWANVERNGILKESVRIPLPNHPKSQTLGAEVLHHPENDPLSPIIIFSYGFSDDMQLIRYLTVPLVYAGYDVLTYDCRGKKTSRRVGRKTDFPAMIDDLDAVVQYLTQNPRTACRPIYLIGISLGAIFSLYQGIWNQKIHKVVAIAAMSNYRHNFQFSPITFIRKWWIWLRYTLFGVNFNPTEETNTKLSPVLQMQLSQKQPEFEQNPSKWVELVGRKIYYIHAVDDAIIPLSNFYENRKNSRTPPAQWLLSRKGDHLFRQQELSLITGILHALNENSIVPQ